MRKLRRWTRIEHDWRLRIVSLNRGSLAPMTRENYTRPSTNVSEYSSCDGHSKEGGPLFQVDSLQMKSLTRKNIVCCFSFGTPKFIEGGDSLFEPLLAGYPKLVPTLHDISQHRSSQKYHVLSPRRIFDPDLEFL